MNKNYKLFIFVSVIVLSFLHTNAQIRSIDCYGVNKEHPTWGMVNDTLVYNSPVSFANGISEPAGKDRKNPRSISNVIFAQDKFMPNEKKLSDYIFMWGQFIDHDLTLVVDNADEKFNITVPRYDAWMDPFGTGNALIPMSRSMTTPGTGTSVENPRRFSNAITGYLDGSVVYGSSENEAKWIRTFVDGKLKTSKGNLLPYNTITGELESEIDPEAPFMDMRGSPEKHFVAGERRVNENPLLIAMHTTFVREHNLQCDKIKTRHPDWDDERIYQRARKIIGGIIQNITFYEWFPTLTGKSLPEYNGYDASINPQISNIFSAAAFRLGHTLINSTIMRMDQTSHHMGESEMRLADAFFRPELIRENDGIEYFLKGSCYQNHQTFDAKIIDDLRNMLFGPPGAGGLDLAAINIQRGRERGLADYNTLRKSFGLKAYSDFEQITDDAKLVQSLYEIYDGDINNIDPFVGILAEKHTENSNVGELIETILSEQFVRLREGDPYYFLVDPELTVEEIYEISNTRFGEIVKRTSNMNTIPADIFLTEPDIYEVRAITGINNNLKNPDWGCSFTPMVRFGTNGYSDKISIPAGHERPNTREISNSIFAQDHDIYDNLELSDFVFNWGQFMDHDFTLVGDTKDSFFIKVPIGDPMFDPQSTGTKFIPVFRSKFDENSGTSPLNPRNHKNEVTAFIDASTVYGSTEERTQWLRTYDGGKLKVSRDNLMPYNTYSGEYEDAVDPGSPHMAHAITPPDGKWFVAGEERANENPLLIAIHTLWVREHNRICAELSKENPEWKDEVLFQEARRIVIAKIANITYNEWLPAIGIHLPKYEGYNPEMNPQVMNLFSAAGFRFGHTIINGVIQRLNDDCSVHESGHTRLKDTYFDPSSIREKTSNLLEPYFIGMMHHRQQGFDTKVIEDVRNFLFGAPGSGGMDLVAINIQRGRERGLADYNTTRKDFGLLAKNNFSSLTSKPELNQALESLYGDINDIDLWVGLLSEDHLPGSLFGELGTAIMRSQFQHLRDGDRFFFEVDKGLSEEQKMNIRYTTLGDVLSNNTLMEDVPYNIFNFQGICTDVADVNKPSLDLNIFPNPGITAISLEITSDIKNAGIVKLTTILGQTILTDQIEISEGSNNYNFDISALSPGIYIVNIVSEKGNFGTRFVKQ
jgi:peroxidase